MTTNETLIPVPGRLHSVATEGNVAGADEIYDDDLGKKQSEINQEHDIIEGYYYNEAFYSDSEHTTIITGEAHKLYIDFVNNETYRYNGSGYSKTSASITVDSTSVYDKNTIDNKIQDINNRISTLESSINQSLDELESLIQELLNLNEKTKHVFLTQALYDALDSYDDNTIYFIIKSSGFNYTFPFTLE